MRTYLTLVRRELGTHFMSWTGYVVVSAVLFLLGLCFVSLVTYLNTQTTDEPIIELFLYRTAYFWLILLLVSPVITMRTFALEKYSGTFETLMTVPVSDLEVVLAKFTGALVVFMLLWFPLIGYVLLLRSLGHDPSALDWPSLVSMFLGIFLLGSLFMSVGCFASALTRSLMVAATLGYLLGISIFLVSFLAYSYTSQPGWVALVFQHVCAVEHMKDFARGVVDTRALVFYLTLSGFFLYLTLKVIQSRRWT